MNAKKLAPLIVALILGGIAAKMAFNFVQKRQISTLSDLKHNQVVVAKHSVDAGQMLTPDDLTMGDVSSDAVMDSFFTSADQVAGRVTVVPIVQGQAIATTLLAPKGMGAGLQAAVPLGMRAATFEINEMTGVAGYIVPGCHVDIIQTLKDEKTGMPLARTLAQNVKVTAVGVKHNPQDGDGGGHSVTLLLKPDQVEMLELASSIGRPRFSLRGGNDLNQVETKGVTFTELVGHPSRREEFASDMTTVPTTQPITTISNTTVAPTTQPTLYDTDNDQWTVEVIRGGAASEVKFAVHKSDGEFTNTDPSDVRP
jgi:pilus assembly protein CpaB